MRVFLQSLDKKVWKAVEIGWTKPKEAPADWDEAKIKAANFNSKALNALFSAVTNEEFKKISSIKTTKEVWTILQTTYEGTKAIKYSKLQRLTTSFEEIKIKEDESFDEFYAKLKDIANSAFNLGETILGPKIVKKVLRSLPERFHAKITVIEESKDIDKILLTKLVRNLQTYELGLSRISKSGKGKSMAFKAKSSDTDESSNDEDSKMKSYITRQFKKFMKNANVRSFDKENRQSSSFQFKGQDKEEKDAKDGSHIGKSKALAATLSDTEPEDDSNDEDDRILNAFTATINPTEGIVKDVEEEEELVDSKLATKKLSDVKLDREELFTKFEEANQTIGALRFENNLLAEKTKKLKAELFQVRAQLERTSSAKLDEMLNIQKSASDRTGLGYGHSSSNIASTSTTDFVPLANKDGIENNDVKNELASENLDKGLTPSRSAPSRSAPSTSAPSSSMGDISLGDIMAQLQRMDARLDILSTELYQVNVRVSRIARRQAAMGGYAFEATLSPPPPVASDSDAEDDDDDGDDNNASNDDDGDASSTDEMST
ncbi:uncharacterized protein LOC136068445 [Quercus suber]|uniref:uncharacterized protein LOC136068445 n=1 Tax=Quercus suber TaxID=58331 RepID=UPI0032DF2AB9